MLNTKYIIAEDENGQLYPYLNEDANGNAWFVQEIEKVANANEEILLLDSLQTKYVAITTDKKFAKPEETYKVDSLSSISLIEAKPNYLKYESSNKNEGFAVFSEIFYGSGWISKIDGNEAPHYRVNYVLRGMEIPKGNHIIEFSFEPDVIKTGSSIALASSILFGLLIIGGIYFKVRKK